MEFNLQMVIWFFAVSSLILLVYLLVGKPRSRVDTRLEAITALNPPLRGMLDSPSPRPSESSLGRSADRRRRRQEKPDKSQQDMIQAGLYRPGAMNLISVARVVLAIVPALCGFMAAQLGRLSLTDGLVFGGIAGLAGTLAPTYWLSRVKRTRQTKIRRAMPDALDVMVVCLEGGLTLGAALARIARELASAHPLLAVELTIVDRQIQMGRSVGEALREMANRFDLEELRGLASVILQAERLGTSLVGALVVFADTLRQRRFQRAEELAQQASVKILFPTILCIFPAIFVVIIGPAAYEIYKTFIQAGIGGN